MSSFCEWRKLTSRNLYFSFSVYLYSFVPEAWAPSVSGGSWPAEISTLASMFIHILWCLKNELLLWVEEANYTYIYSGFCQCSGSGSSHKPAKKWRKPWNRYTVLWLLCDFLSLKNDVNVLSKRNKHKNFLFSSWRSLTKKAGSGAGSVPKCHCSWKLVSIVLNILWCLKHELLLWVEEADQQKSLF